MAKMTGTSAAAMTTTTKIVLALFTALRLALVLDLFPSPISTQLNSPALASALVNPLYTVEHLREGNFLLEFWAAASPDHGGTLDQAYEGMAFHLPPLLLLLFRPIFTTIQSQYMQDIIIGVLFVATDLAVALCLYDNCRRILLCANADTEREEKLEAGMDDKIRPKRAWIFGIDAGEQDSSPENPIIQPVVVTISDLPELCSLLYYCNPVSIVASCGTKAQSLQSLWYLLLLGSIREATSITTVPGSCSQRRWASTPLATFFLALLSYIELYSIVYVVPISIWVGRSHASNTTRGIAECILYFSLWFGLLQALSAFLVGDWTTVCAKTYGYVYGFVDLSPNMGLSWYFFMQIFDRFRRYFVAMFAMIKFVFIAPLTVRLHKYPTVLVVAFFLLGTLYMQVQTLHDASIGLAMILIAPRSVARMGNASLVFLFAIIVPATLYVMDYWLWLETGSGNANYMFFQCLAYNVFLAIMTLDFVSASVKRDKALRLTEKLATQKSPRDDDKANKSE